MYLQTHDLRRRHIAWGQARTSAPVEEHVQSGSDSKYGNDYAVLATSEVVLGANFFVFDCD